VIQIALLRDIGRAFPLGEQLRDWQSFGRAGAKLIERKLGVKPPAKYGKRKQQNGHTYREAAFAVIHLEVVARVHSSADSLSVYEAYPY
jgi:hypothetical protein